MWGCECCERYLGEKGAIKALPLLNHPMKSTSLDGRVWRVFTVIMIRIFEQLVCCSIQSISPRGLHMFDNFSSVFCIHKESDEYTLRLMTYYSQRSDDGNVFCVHNEGENERKSHKYTNCMLKGLNLKCNIPSKRSRRRRRSFPKTNTSEG